jgi:molecular chaperone DnaK
VNVDEAIVLGASLFSALKGDQADLNPVQKASISKLTVTDVSVGCFGTSAVRGSNHEEYIAILIKKNEKIPCSVTETFYTMLDNQTEVDCKITQSDSATDDPKWVNTIWDGSLSLPSGRKAGQKVDVTYSYDENGTMHASFVDVATGKETHTSLSDIAPTVDEKGDIDRFIVD